MNRTKMDVDYEHILKLHYDTEFLIKPLDITSVIFDENRNKVSLNGKWNYCIDVFDTFLRKRFFEEKVLDENQCKLPVDFSFDDWEEIVLPNNWNLLKPEYYFYEGTVVFTRKFEWKKNKGKRVILKIGAANYETKIWLNKNLIGRHLGGYTPFYIDITNELEDENRLILTVNNTRKLENVPSINFDWFNFGGIFRDIELFEVPEKEIIKEVFFYLDKKNNKKIKYQIKLLNDSEQKKVTIEIPELNIFLENYTDKEGKCFGEIEVGSLELWSLDKPKLYEIVIKTSTDIVKDYIGFRTIQVNDSKVYLNNKEIFLKGICVHEESEKNGRALNENEILNTLNTAKELGCNFIRLTHYPHSERVSKLADKLGILLWEEVPVYWALDFENEITNFTAQNQLKELILRDRNRASVIIWSIGNENPDTDSRLIFMTKLANIAKELDGTRLISAACLVNIDNLRIEDRLCSIVDIVGINEYYGWYYRDEKKLVDILRNSDYLQKPVLISETGAEAVPKYFGSKHELYTEECQEKMYKDQIDMIKDCNYICGISPWILFDYRTQVRMNKYQKGYNLKGIISRERDYKKKAYYVLKDFYFKK